MRVYCWYNTEKVFCWVGMESLEAMMYYVCQFRQPSLIISVSIHVQIVLYTEAPAIDEQDPL